DLAVKSAEFFAFTLRVRAQNTYFLTDAEQNVLHYFPTRRSSDLDTEPFPFEVLRAGLHRVAEVELDAQTGFLQIGLYLTPDSRRSEEHTSELQSRVHVVCRLLLEKKKNVLSIALVVRSRCEVLKA